MAAYSHHLHEGETVAEIHMGDAGASSRVTTRNAAPSWHKGFAFGVTWHIEFASLFKLLLPHYQLSGHHLCQRKNGF